VPSSTFGRLRITVNRFSVCFVETTRTSSWLTKILISAVCCCHPVLWNFAFRRLINTPWALNVCSWRSKRKRLKFTQCNERKAHCWPIPWGIGLNGPKKNCLSAVRVFGHASLHVLLLGLISLPFRFRQFLKKRATS